MKNFLEKLEFQHSVSPILSEITNEKISLLGQSFCSHQLT